MDSTVWVRWKTAKATLCELIVGMKKEMPLHVYLKKYWHSFQINKDATVLYCHQDLVPFNWDIQLTVYLFVIPLICLVADYNRILFLNPINGYSSKKGWISKSLGVVKKDKHFLASNMQMTHLKASESYITKNIYTWNEDHN